MARDRSLLPARAILPGAVLACALVCGSVAAQPAGPASAVAPILEAARVSAEATPDPHTRARCLSAVAEAYAHVGLPDAADATFDQALAAADEAPTARHLALEIGQSAANAGRAAKAAEVAGRLDSVPDQVHVLCGAARAADRSADSAYADVLLADCRARTASERDPEQAARALARVAEVCRDLGRNAEYEAVMDGLWELARGLPRGLGRSAVLDQLAREYLESRRYTAALEAAEAIEHPAFRLTLILQLAADMREDDPAAADALLARAVDEADDIGDDYRRTVVLISAADAYLIGGEVQPAARVLHDAADALRKLQNPLHRAAAGDKLLRVCSAHGQFDLAEETADAIEDDVLRSESLLAIAFAQADAGDGARALRTASRADSTSLKFLGAESLDRLAGLRFGASEAKAPPAVVALIEPPELADAVLARYSRAHGEGRDYARALGYVEAMHSPLHQADAMVEVAGLCAAAAGTMADLEPARAIVERLKDTNDKLRVQVTLAAATVRLGSPAEARDALEAVRSDLLEEAGPTTQAELLVEVALGFHELGLPGQAEAAAADAMAGILRISCASCRIDLADELLKRLVGRNIAYIAVAMCEHQETPRFRGDGLMQVIALNGDLAPQVVEPTLRKALRAGAEARPADRRCELLAKVAEAFARNSLSVAEDERALLADSSAKLVRETRAADSRPAPPKGGDTSSLVYFDKPGCRYCAEAKAALKELTDTSPSVQVQYLDLMQSETALLYNRSICSALGVPKEQQMLAPSVFSANGFLIGDEITLSALTTLARDAAGMPSPVRLYPPQPEQPPPADELRLLLVIGAGLADGINPCAFTVIIFFMSYLAYMGRDRKEVAAVGLMFTLAVFVTYLAIGLGLAGLVSAASAWSSRVTVVIYGVTAALAGVAAILSFSDAALCLKGHERQMMLSLPESLRSRIRLTISKRARLGLTVLGTAVLGATVAFFELPCTGQMYLPIIMVTLKHANGSIWGPVGWLVLYNVCFIAPLIAVFVAAFFGMKSEKLTALFRRHMVAAKLAMGLLFAALAAYMVRTLLDAVL